MRISVKCSSAVHILLMLALPAANNKMTSEYIAKSLGNNPVEVRRLMGGLKAAGIIEVARGSGGATLKKDPKDITLLSIYEAVDPTSLDGLIGIHAHPSDKCPFGRNITALLLETYAGIGDAVKEKMRAVSLESLMLRLREIEPAL